MKHIWVLIGLFSLMVTGCTANWIIPEDYYVECESDADCPDTADCMLTDDGTARVCVTKGRAECGNGVQEAGETCDDGDDNTLGYGIAGRCNPDCDGFAPHCGDGTQNGGESCDQGAANTDAYGIEGSCNLECSGLAPHCGDGVVNGGEACDLGAANSDDYGLPGRCNANCSGEAPSCGDGVTNASEICDDGTNNADGYSANITCNTTCNGYALYCGDGFINGDEDCDDGNQEDDGNGCSADCARCTSPEQCPQSGAVSCGDNEVHTAFETCDDGNSETEGCPYGTPLCYVCNAGCQVQDRVGAYCGDGIVQQRGIEGGTTFFTDTDTDGEDTGEWEGCDSTEEIACSALHSSLGTGMATCHVEHPADSSLNCVGYDTSSCSNQDVVFVPAGPFMMGCNQDLDGDCYTNESPYHEVYLDSYVINKTEVTAGAYRPWCEATASCGYKNDHPSYLATTDWYVQYQTYDNNRDDHPINVMNYNDATAYCAGQNMRLPTEAEWEKAARGADGRVFPWGLALPTCQRAVASGWYNDPAEGWIEGYGCGKDRTWAVGSIFAGASPYGAMDMSGNVWEWVSDWYGSTYYTETSYENPEGPISGSSRVLRGGSFRSVTNGLRASVRDYGSPVNRYDYSGFRCAQ
jgi:cysteine-rich repeat protein